MEKKICSILLFFLLTASGCKKESKSGSIITGGQIDLSETRLEPYIDSFMDHLAMTGQTPDLSQLQVQFSDTLLSTQLGSCRMATGLVKINRALWLTLSAGSREELIFHELGHCALSRNHNSTVISGVPTSIMFPYHLGTIYQDPTNYPHYISELFSVANAMFAGLFFNPANYALASSMSEGDLAAIQPEQSRIFRCSDED